LIGHNYDLKKMTKKKLQKKNNEKKNTKKKIFLRTDRRTDGQPKTSSEPHNK